MPQSEGHHTQHIAFLLRKALETSQGHLRVATATEYLIGQLERNRFNSERAREVYGMAIDNVFWHSLKGAADRRQVYADYLQSDRKEEPIRQLISGLTRNGAIPDQRPVRRHLRWLLGA
jgi:hypothetical protein